MSKTERNSLERGMFFKKGFRDGAGTHSIKHEDESDYIEGYKAGRLAYGDSYEEFRRRHNLPKPSILRTMEVE